MFNQIFKGLLLLVLLFSYSCKDTTTNPVEKIGTIKGQVINSISQTPMPNANVTTEPPSSSILSGSDGSFEITDLEEGTYTVKAQKSNFICQPVQIKVNANKTTTVVIMMTDSSDLFLGKIQGKVYDNSTKLPLSDVKIVTAPISETIYSKADGSFEYSNLPAGDYTLSFTKDSYNLQAEIVKVSAGKTNQVTIYMFDKKSSNKPPYNPIITSPSLNSTVTKKDVTLRWSCSDPDGDALKYDVILDTQNPPTTMIASNLNKSDLLYSLPKDSTVYYWKIIAKDIYGASSESEVYQFTYKTVSISSELLLYYNFDNSDASDVSGHGNHGTLKNSPSFVDGKFGKSLRLTGTSDLKGNGPHVIIPSLGFKSMSEFTIALWIKEESLQYYAGEAYINWGNASTGWIGISNFVKPPDNNKLFVNFSAGSASPYSSQTPLWTNFDSTNRNKWVHYALVFKDNTVSGYINGIALGTNIQKITTLDNVAAIGKHWWNFNETSSATSMTFQIDEVRVYNKALTSDEILSLAN